MEGDSVTLHTGLNEIQIDDVIEWTHEDLIIARINELNKSTVKLLNANNLQLDNQTGDLKIRNIRTAVSGLYRLEINSARGLSSKAFNVSGVSDLTSDGVKSVSVLERDSVILYTGITKIQREVRLTWKFIEKDALIAEINKTAGIFSTYDDVLDGRFRGRLHLNHQTGSLIITNVKPNISGLYEINISKSSSRYTTHKTFSVTSIDGENRLMVKVGGTITLHTNVSEIQIYDRILWRFEHGDSIIAKLDPKSGKFSTFDGTDAIFKDSLKLDSKTGSLTISKIRADHAGLYHVDITSSRHTTKFKRIILTVCSVPDSGLSSGIVIAICCVGVGVGVLLAIIAALVYCNHKTTSYVKANHTEVQ
ncbi:uncharacterized protein LOC122144862 [Cyprinus carpio]|uniref:Uncharacterized protein LOC122144862 n=1 Tax=Cyprinus carpio TaxID=7962 RepID=A0A9Q9Y1T8_CYPCA|nr:uncharacterized protein LOC122144862 [Cyprinus carpio]